MTHEFTDEQGNPVEINNRQRQAREKRAGASERPHRPTREEVRRYDGFIPAPKVYSSLEEGMVPTGRELRQCPECGFWISDKPSFQEEQEHERQHK